MNVKPTLHKKYDPFLLKFGIDLRYSRAYWKKREDLLKTDLEYKHYDQMSLVLAMGGFLIMIADLFLILGLYDNFPLIALCLGIVFAFIAMLTTIMSVSLLGKRDCIFSQTPIEIVEESA
ncbi:MAG: hypothetical protein RBR26_05480 [Methanosarcina mazei]|nr:hypothetical protein [Methanosarcina mazei]